MFKLSWFNFAILSKLKVMQSPMHCIYTSYLFFPPEQDWSYLLHILSKVVGVFMKILELTQNIYKY